MFLSRYIRQASIFSKYLTNPSVSLSFNISNMSQKLSLVAPEKNKTPILEVLQKVVPEKLGDVSPINVLEIGAGSGQHAVYFAEQMPNLVWHPSDVDEKYIESIKAYIEESQLSNVRQPVLLNVADFNNMMNDLDEAYHMIVSVNLTHITPWRCTEGLFKAAGKLLSPGGILVTYGPFSIHGEITPESNVRFDESLKEQNAEFGLRDVDDLEQLAKENSLSFDAMFDMPANNKTLIWLKSNISE